MEEALQYFRDALVIFKEIGHKQDQPTILSNIGLIYIDKGELEEALKYSQQALVAAKEIEDREGQAFILRNIGVIYIKMGDADEALNCLKEVLSVSDECEFGYFRDDILNAIKAIEDKK